jgi:epoxyqueuosine reductase
VKRIGRNRLVRNALYAIGASGEAALMPAAAQRLDDKDETVREAARWALAELSPCRSNSGPAAPRSDRP